MKDSAKIGLFYGSSTCYTEIAAEKIQQHIVNELGKTPVDLFNIADEPIETANDYTLLIFGIPTWDYGELQEDWENIWDEIDLVNFKGKKVALYGLGDQIGYSEWFLDALGYLHSKLLGLGATPVGYWPSEHYTFEASQALTESGDQFVGLALDEENEFDKSDERIRTWCQQVLNEFGLLYQPPS